MNTVSRVRKAHAFFEAQAQRIENWQKQHHSLRDDSPERIALVTIDFGGYGLARALMDPHYRRRANGALRFDEALGYLLHMLFCFYSVFGQTLDDERREHLGIVLYAATGVGGRRLPPWMSGARFLQLYGWCPISYNGKRSAFGMHEWGHVAECRASFLASFEELNQRFEDLPAWRRDALLHNARNVKFDYRAWRERFFAALLPGPAMVMA